jgi:heme oxygenase (biliverdin-producing, ferredoxin)
MQTMNNLKELTKEQHKNAERSLFVKNLLKKQITPFQYYVYLSNQFLMYSTLEHHVEESGILRGLENIKRSLAIAKDLSELEKEHNFRPTDVLNSTMKYMKYIYKIKEDRDKLLAHIYVRHMGDLSGGQIIKRFTPGSGAYYEFDSDVTELKEKLREKLHDGLATEAKNCFEMISEFMEELEKSLGMVAAN